MAQLIKNNGCMSRNAMKSIVNMPIFGPIIKQHSIKQKEICQENFLSLETELNKLINIYKKRIFDIKYHAKDRGELFIIGECIVEILILAECWYRDIHSEACSIANLACSIASKITAAEISEIVVSKEILDHIKASLNKYLLITLYVPSTKIENIHGMISGTTLEFICLSKSKDGLKLGIKSLENEHFLDVEPLAIEKIIRRALMKIKFKQYYNI